MRFVRLTLLFTLAPLMALAGPVHAAPAPPRATAPRSSPRLHIRRVALRGLHQVSARVLQRVAKKVVPRGRLSAAQRARVARQVQRRLRERLQDLGFLAARVSVRERRPGPYTSFVILEAFVTEGHRLRVGALDVTGVSPADRLRALHRLPLRSGQILGAGDLRQGRTAVATVFADRGHAFVSVQLKPRIHADGRLVDLTFYVRPGPVARIAAIRIRGASPTGRLLIRRALVLGPGDRYHRSRLQGSIERLRKTGAFEHIRWSEARVGKDRVALDVQVTERPLSK